MFSLYLIPFSSFFVPFDDTVKNEISLIKDRDMKCHCYELIYTNEKRIFRPPNMEKTCFGFKFLVEVENKPI